MKENCSLVILTALKEEFDYFSESLGINRESSITKNKISFYPFLFECKNNNLHQGVLAFIGDMGPADAQAVTIIALEYFTPEYFVTIGVSGSLDNDVKLGDVIFVTSSENYEYRGKWHTDQSDSELSFDKFQFGGDTQNVDELKNLFDNFEIQSPDFMRKFNNNSEKFLSSLKNRELLKKKGLIGNTTSIQVGLVCSGNSVCSSELFKKVLKTHNRNYIAVDMETWGYAKALKRCDESPIPIFIRCISDPADYRKKMLDEIGSGLIREFAVKNGFNVMLSVLSEKLSFQKIYQNPDELDTLNKFIIENYVDFPHDLNSFQGLPFCQALENMFRIIGTWDDTLVENNRKLPLYSFIKSIFDNNKDNSLIIKGPNGTGKSTFLAYLYFQFKYDLDSNNLDKIPVYINLKKYNRKKDFLKNEKDIQDKFLNDLNIINQLCRGREIILIIDGVDELFSQSSRFSNFVLNKLKSPKISKNIIGFCISDHIYHHEAQRKITDVHFDNTQNIIEFNRINVNSILFKDFVEKFVLINNIKSGPVKIDFEIFFEKINKFKLEYIDIFLLSMILEKFTDPYYKEIDDIHRFISQFCDDFIHSQILVEERDVLLKISNLAHSLCINKTDISSTGDYEKVAWDLCNLHSTVRNYLIAYFTVTKLCQVDEKEEDYKCFDFVYPYEINIFSKSLINQNIASQKAIFNNIKSIYGNVRVVARAHFCYLLGRINDKNLSEDVKNYLDKLLVNESKRYKKAWTSKQNKYKDEVMLLLRSIYISLVYLGNEEASDKYIERIVEDEYWNSVNRGFHLQYYGDIKYDPKENLSLTDKGGDISITFRLLSERIIDRIKNRNFSDSFDIELFTLCSLSHSRFIEGKLSKRKKDVILGIIDCYIAIGSENDLMWNYVNSVKYDLNNKNYESFDVIDKLYNLKVNQRSGWIIRGVQNSESIADHICFTMLLALLLIPDRIAEFRKKIDKNKLIKMLLIHDLAESIVGDKRTSEKTKPDKDNERLWMMYFSFLGLKYDFPDTTEVRKLYDEFENRTSPEAKIAKDIDKLEAIFQAYIYNRNGYETNLEDWKSKEKMKTKIGNHLKSKIIDYFEKNNF